ncbi:hypothetical protein HA402_006847 [Bradysia odoriphaga]|nr:hypothetical protein HA402_006847 [Bradysia odoriphaga]
MDPTDPYLIFYERQPEVSSDVELLYTSDSDEDWTPLDRKSRIRSTPTNTKKRVCSDGREAPRSIDLFDDIPPTRLGHKTTHRTLQDNELQVSDAFMHLFIDEPPINHEQFGEYMDHYKTFGFDDISIFDEPPTDDGRNEESKKTAPANTGIALFDDIQTKIVRKWIDDERGMHYKVRVGTYQELATRIHEQFGIEVTKDQLLTWSKRHRHIRDTDRPYRFTDEERAAIYNLRTEKPKPSRLQRQSIDWENVQLFALAEGFPTALRLKLTTVNFLKTPVYNIRKEVFMPIETGLDEYISILQTSQLGMRYR